MPSAPVSINAPGGFLFEWWSVFWGIFIARTNEKHSDSATSYLEHGYSIRTFTGHSASVMSLDFHPNKDDLICSCDGDNEMRFWSIKHGSVVGYFKGGSTQLRFQPRYGGYLATASDNAVSILDVETLRYKLA